MPRKVEVNVRRVAGAWGRSLPAYSAKVQRWCEGALIGVRGKALCVVLADDAMLCALNRTYRGKDKPTNVLSFAGAGEELGDIVLAYETVKAEAKAQGKTFLAHTAHLVVHGCLHLLGYNHEKEREAARMEAHETKILARFGITNPYEAP